MNTKTKATLTLLTALLLAPLATLHAADTSLPVFILVGQSNMTGADSESSATIPGPKGGERTQGLKKRIPASKRTTKPKP